VLLILVHRAVLGRRRKAPAAPARVRYLLPLHPVHACWAAYHDSRLWPTRPLLFSPPASLASSDAQKTCPLATPHPPRPSVSASNVFQRLSCTASRPQTRHRASTPAPARCSTRLLFLPGPPRYTDAVDAVTGHTLRDTVWDSQAPQNPSGFVDSDGDV
jgi:hypothetical protein